jgi:hypothetical protein
MAVTGAWYRNALGKAFNKEIDFDSDTIKATLHTSTYTPNLDTDAYVSALSNEVSGTGYTTGGGTLTSVSIAYTVANSWGTSRANSTAYTVDQLVRPASANGFVYRCAVAGTSTSSPPTYPTVVGTTVADGTVTWECAGSGVLLLSGTIPSWTSSTITARYCVISDRTPGTAATQPLIVLVDFGSNQSSTSGTFSVAAANGLAAAVIA